MAKDTSDPDLADAEPEEFARFKDLASKLLTVPKSKVDAERKNGNGSH